MDKTRTILEFAFCVFLFKSSFSQDVACNHTLEEMKGWFTSPNFPKKYRNNKQCSWQIHAPSAAPESRIQLRFVSFGLKPRKGNDYVEVYDGPNESYGLLGRYDGKDLPPKKGSKVIEGTQSWMTVKFVSDGAKRSHGFNATYHVKDKPDVWGRWMDVSLCKARPCNCTKSDRVSKKTDCPRGKVLQIRGCNNQKCLYEGNYGPIRQKDCYNLNKLCPGWSEYKVVDSCRCKDNQTEGTQTLLRTCTNPSPIVKGLQCVLNDDQEALEDSRVERCTCEETYQTTEPSTTTEKLYCECKNSTSGASGGEIPTIGPINFNATTTTTPPTTTTTDPFGLSIDYSNQDDKNLCLCSSIANNTLANNGTQSDEDDMF